MPTSAELISYLHENRIQVCGEAWDSVPSHNTTWVQYKRRFPGNRPNSLHYEVKKDNDDETRIVIGLHCEPGTDMGGRNERDVRVLLGGQARHPGLSENIVNCADFDTIEDLVAEVERQMSQIAQIYEPLIQNLEQGVMGVQQQADTGGQGGAMTKYGATGMNKIVFGAPGTGKSYRLNKEAKESFEDANIERVTFYATYSYAQFVGSYKPVMNGEGDNEKIAYEFVPGPFLRMLVKAQKNQSEKFLLIIEEINRANAAAVFGDMFQLLDRDTEGKSDYDVATSEDLRRYLIKEGIGEGAAEKIRIPKNFYIWATMNSADQGVFPLDTAFKRRWSFEYIGIDNGEDDAANLTIAGGGTGGYKWKKLRKFLNGLLTEYGVNEDKLMGSFFLKDASEFGSKVLMYLWEDAARMCRRAFFGKIKTYADLLKEWQQKGVGIFKEQKSVREGALKNSYEDLLSQSGADANDTNS